MATKKNNIKDYKDRTTAPIGAVRIDPKTRQPIKANGTKKKGK